MSELKESITLPTPDAPAAAMSKTDKLNIVSLVVLLGFLLGLLISYWNGIYHNLPYPWNTFLYRPGSHFGDLYNFYIQLTHTSNDPALFYNYLPFTYLALSFLTLIPYPILLRLFLFGVIAGFWVICHRELRTASKVDTWRNVIILTFCSYPFLFALDRCNIEPLMFFATYLGVTYYANNRPWLSSVWIALAAATKMYPILLVLLPLAEKRYRRAAAIILVTGALTLFGFLVYYHGFKENVAAFFSGIGGFTQYYTLGYNGIFYNHSLFGLIRLGARVLVGKASVDQWPVYAHYYNYLVLILFALMTVFILRVRLELWKRVALLTCAMNLFPPVSFDYKLLQLYIPLFLFLNTNTPERYARWYAVLFGLLLIPKAYFRLSTSFPEANSSGITNPLLMLALALTIVITGLQEARRSKAADA